MSFTRRSLRPLWVMLYAAFVGLLLASYVQPLQEIAAHRANIPALESKLRQTEQNNAEQRRLAKELDTPAGIERAARERYGMIRDGEKVYIVEK
ncbi:MAG TPA: septum formation initiator family protein [Rubrobacteraceae bacterium]|nr:septum formation initiator family protein [Rubrobacteraceae bacterium]